MSGLSLHLHCKRATKPSMHHSFQTVRVCKDSLSETSLYHWLVKQPSHADDKSTDSFHWTRSSDGASERVNKTKAVNRSDNSVDFTPTQVTLDMNTKAASHLLCTYCLWLWVTGATSDTGICCFSHDQMSCGVTGANYNLWTWGKHTDRTHLIHENI